MTNKKDVVIKKLKRFQHNINSFDKSILNNSNDKKANSGIHYRGYLPHFDFDGLYQNITYRLNDSLSKETLENILLNSESDSNRRKEIEEKLDAGYGSCILKLPLIANMIIENWQYFNEKKYDLIAYVVMPNHVHILIKIYSNSSISNIVHSWKSYTSKRIKEILSKEAKNAEDLEFVDKIGWQEDYWDRYIRDEVHYFNAVEYIHNNPVKAGLCENPTDWKFSSLNQLKK